MRKSLYIISLLVMGIIAPNARADKFIEYKINFTAPPGSLLPTSGTIIYDKTPGAANPFSEFTVTWDGELFDYTTVANDYTLASWGTPVPGYIYIPTSAGCTGPTGIQPVIVVLTTCTADAIWFAQADVTTGTASFSIEYNTNGENFPYFVDLLGPPSPPPDTTVRVGLPGGLPLSIARLRHDVPEPGTVVLMLLGIGFVLVIRKRVALSIQ